MKSFVFGFMLTLPVVIGYAALAEDVAISEPGFEADGAWKFAQTGLGVNGFFSDRHAAYIEAGIIDPLADRGSHFAYNNGPQHDLYQVLKATVAAETTYTLRIKVLDASFANPFPGGQLRLGYVSEKAGDEEPVDGDADDYGVNLFKPVSVVNPTPVNDVENNPDDHADGIATWAYTFRTGKDPKGLGRPLRIELFGGGSAQAIFDNVSLTAEPNEAVPPGDDAQAVEDQADAAVESPVIVMLGDSVTEQGLPRQVQKLMDGHYAEGERPTLINAGKGYDNATSALKRLEKDVLAHDPDLVTISFGLNDTGGRDPEQFMQSLQQMVKTFNEAKVRVVLITSTPFDNARHGWAKDRVYQELGGLDDYMDRAFCKQMRLLAKEKGLAICDLHQVFTDAFEKDPELIKQVIASDGVHLTDAGRVLAAKHIAALLKQQIAEFGP